MWKERRDEVRLGSFKKINSPEMIEAQNWGIEWGRRN